MKVQFLAMGAVAAIAMLGGSALAGPAGPVFARSGCTVNTGSCGSSGDCVVNTGTCENDGHCTVNTGYCSEGEVAILGL